MEKPSSRALTCKKCQDCCDDHASEAARAVRETIDAVYHRLKQALSSGAASAFVGAVGTLRPIALYFTPEVFVSPTLVVHDPNWQEFKDAVRPIARQEDLIYWQPESITVTITSGSALVDALFDGARAGLAKRLRRIRDDCKECCLRKAFKQDNPQLVEEGKIRRRQ